jgi:hypothetical protein
MPPAYIGLVHVENVVFDATDPQALGRFWETALGTETVFADPSGNEFCVLPSRG